MEECTPFGVKLLLVRVKKGVIINDRCFSNKTF